jgi:hypothetical protein
VNITTGNIIKALHYKLTNPASHDVFVYDSLNNQITCLFQLVWFAKELVKNNMVGADSVMHSLLRQVAGILTLYLTENT